MRVSGRGRFGPAKWFVLALLVLVAGMITRVVVMLSDRTTDATGEAIGSASVAVIGAGLAALIAGFAWLGRLTESGMSQLSRGKEIYGEHTVVLVAVDDELRKRFMTLSAARGRAIDIGGQFSGRTFLLVGQPNRLLLVGWGRHKNLEAFQEFSWHEVASVDVSSTSRGDGRAATLRIEFPIRDSQSLVLQFPVVGEHRGEFPPVEYVQAMARRLDALRSAAGSRPQESP